MGAVLKATKDPFVVATMTLLYLTCYNYECVQRIVG